MCDGLLHLGALLSTAVSSRKLPPHAHYYPSLWFSGSSTSLSVCACAMLPLSMVFPLLLLSQRLVLRIGNTGPDTTNGPASGWSVCLLSYVHLGRCCCCCCGACTSVWCCCCCPCTHGSDFPVDNGDRLGNDSA